MGGNSGCDDAFTSITAAYSERHRSYHTAQHILDCLSQFDSVIETTDRPDEVEMAIWLHDVIYKVFAKNNEEMSAQYAEHVLRDGGVDEDAISHVKKLIRITDHHNAPSSPDEMLIIDIDLSILGQSEERYEEYEQAVRSEYKVIPSFIYKKKRAQLLSAFLSRKSIYHTEHFSSKFESKAKMNLENSIRELKA
jgi:predicted metal-dependent HD superfamily phosphohydrolase